MSLAIAESVVILEDQEDDSDWESVPSSGASSDTDGSESDEDKRIAAPPLLPIARSIASPTDSLCNVCKDLKLSPKRFVVLPSNKKKRNKPDDPDINMGTIRAIRSRSHCPFCRLVLVALGGEEVPDKEDRKDVSVVMSWNTDGIIPDVDEPWNHIPQIRTLNPSAKKSEEDYLDSKSLNLFPEITLLANDSPTDLRPYLPVSFATTALTLVFYVWGKKANFLRTLSNTVNELEKPGALLRPEFYDRIPMTIRDAMQVVREIGLQYLWVDCLCIVQDDETGSKADAIAKMDVVYGGAFVTIMAASGKDANSGLPGVRPGTRGERQAIEEIMPGFRLAYKTTYEDCVDDVVYYTRAWTFQERQFTSRSLIFIGGQVVFSCGQAHEWREDVVCEDKRIVSKQLKAPETNDIANFEGLIQSYSELSLTFESDIYNAFAGLARYFQSELKTNLCHGIPSIYFDWFLLWYPLEHQKRRKLAPSWSWSGWIATNFYGGRVRDRFPFDCSKTLPSDRMLDGAPEYYKDTLNPTPGSGFLQFWTVSVMLSIKPAKSVAKPGPANRPPRLGIFGRDSSRELGTLDLTSEWCSIDGNVGGTHEFILLCEGRDERAENYTYDEEPGWKYMVMLIEWHGDWAERVSIGSIDRHELKQAMGKGLLWKEIILA
ncbi:heterokaryon incompatibility protein-domain-containing protein [Crucibulum laeve]|uniref:Heterokaryon incompatibility protein-domain-containing protein n=1 Tax=Crucibulum laeve TaxID=68775 RepID=A0A5C3LLZ0_9AGAR|nr:heterokaryon incompatibility protein-domain-containing protein [Crucibulum laeve]